MDTKTRVLSAIEAMTSAFHQGDIEGIMRTYEPVAVVVGQPRRSGAGRWSPEDASRFEFERER